MNILMLIRYIIPSLLIDMDEKLCKDLKRWKEIYRLTGSDYSAMAQLLWRIKEFRNLVIFRNRNDPAWQKERSETLGIKEMNASGNGVCRYRDWASFKYWFRAVEKYAPWVRYVHFGDLGACPILAESGMSEAEDCQS